MTGLSELAEKVRGRVTLWDIPDAGEPKKLCRFSNQLQYTWGHVAARTIAQGDADYRVRAVYVEYENVASPGDPVTVPTFDRDEGLEYYDNLSLSAVRDYLRVPLLVNPSISIEPGFENFFDDGVSGNVATFFTQTQGTTGVHGKAFTAAANSKVFGMALVATPEFADPSKDIVFARTYTTVGEQTLKVASSQIGISWDIVFP